MQLDKRVTIQRRAHTQDAAGQVRETWQNISEVWASIRPLGGREYFASSGPRAEITHEIIIRFGANLLPKDRIEYGDRHFEVVAPMNQGERNRYIKAMSIENADRAN